MSTQSQSLADRVVEFIQKLPLTTGVHAGKRFKLAPFQEDFVRAIYSKADPHGNRKVRRAVLSVARKAGKTELAAALILVHLIGPCSEPNGEIYSAANSREQAAIVFKTVKKMIMAEPSLKKVLTVVDSTKTIYVKPSAKVRRCVGSTYRALSADAHTAHGLNPSFVVYDELAQTKNRELLDALTTSQGARANPLFLTISTQSHDPQHPLSQMIDDGLRGTDETIVCRLYAAPDDCDVQDEDAWAAANPGLAHGFPTREQLQMMADRASRMPSEERNFRLLHLNQRVSATASLIMAADWRACGLEGDRLQPGEPVYLGLDLSSRNDLTALVAVSAEDGDRLKAWAWKGAESVEEHSRRDPFDYAVAVKAGHLLTTHGRTIDPLAVALKVAELTQVYGVRALAYDRWRIDELLRCFDAIGLAAQQGPGPGLRIEPFGQGFRDMAPAVDAFEAAVMEGELQHDHNPLLTWCVMNAQAISDPTGARKLDKSRSSHRIDSAVALVMALGVKVKDRLQVTSISPWENEGFSIALV